MKIVWKIYAFINAILIVLLIIGSVAAPDARLLDKIIGLVYVPSAMAIFGLAFRKAIGAQIIWYVYTILFFGFSIYFFLTVPGGDSGQKTDILDLVLGLIVLAPPYVTNILYAVKFGKFNSPRITKLDPAMTAAAVSRPDPSTSLTAPQAWNMSELAQFDPQQSEIQHQQSLASAQSSLGQSLARDAQASYDEKIEAEQFGKGPWSRWYNHPVMGRSASKGISDWIFLSMFGASSATDIKYTRGQRAFIRIIITLAVALAVAILNQVFLAKS